MEHTEMVSNLHRSQNLMFEEDCPGFFKDYYRSVRKSVTNDQFNQFSKCGTDEARFRYVFALPAVHDIDLKCFFRGKSEKEALEKKEAGNKAFGRKKNLDALKAYSQAVIKAPVPTGKYWKLIKECADPKKMTLYSICLANRSAALFHMKEDYYCVRDIDEALEHHYPKELKYKLFKRKGRILVTLKRHEEARDAYRQALKWLDWAKMDREKRMEQHKEIQKWLQIFETGKVVKNAPLPERQFFPKIPELTEGNNLSFPSLSKKVEVKQDNSQGRFAEAAEDIFPGDTICTEAPYAAVLLREQYGTHCQQCFLITKAPIPCKKCSGVVFCSIECRDKSFFHKIECPIMELLTGSGMSINVFLSLRLLTQSPLSFFSNVREHLDEQSPNTCIKSEETQEGKGGRDVNTFLHIYNLVRHADCRSPEDFFHRTVMVAFLVKALKKTKYFEEKGCDFGDKANDTEAFVGGLLLRFLQIVQFNAHEVSEFMLTAPRTLESSSNESLGAAIYPSLSLFNHSCHGAQIRYFSGNRVVTKAIRYLKKGELVPENYGQCFTTKDKEGRKASLADRYWFDCNCEACHNDWPKYKDMDNNTLTFKCHDCKAPLTVPVNSPQPFFTCGKCGKQTNILSTLKNLQNTEKTFKAAMKEMESYNLAKAEALLLENLKQLDSALYPPYKDYQLTQEAYMRCCLCDGNIRIKEVEEKTTE